MRFSAHSVAATRRTWAFADGVAHVCAPMACAAEPWSSPDQGFPLLQGGLSTGEDCW